MGEEKIHISIQLLGHNCSGKSTTAGHLIYELGGIDKHLMGRYEEEAAEMNKQTSKYAWVLDKLKAEHECITNDIPLLKFETRKYYCNVIDGLGDGEYREKVIRTYQADCVVLMIDSTAIIAKDMLTRAYARHAHAIEVEQMICCCNMMDATTPKYSKDRYDRIVRKFSRFLEKIGYNVEKIPFIPISGLEGDNMIERSANLDWYEGPTLVEALDMLSEPKCSSDKLLNPRLQEILTKFDRVWCKEPKEEPEVPRNERDLFCRKLLFQYPPVPRWPMRER